MPWDASLSTAKDRVRLVLGDINSPEILPDDTYLAALTGASEAAAARRLAAAMAAFLAQQPVSRTTQGEAVDYRERVAHLRRIASGDEPLALADDGGGATLTAGRISLAFQEEHPDGA